MVLDKLFIFFFFWFKKSPMIGQRTSQVRSKIQQFVQTVSIEKWVEIFGERNSRVRS